MFRSSQICLWSQKTGRNRHAEEIYSDPVKIGFSPVRLERVIEKTSVRADSSASRGQADQVVVKTKILIDWPWNVGLDDRIEIDGALYRVAMVHKRYNVWGKLDHKECDLVPSP